MGEIAVTEITGDESAQVGNTGLAPAVPILWRVEPLLQQN
jgi:hypothetical protein